MTEGFLIQNPDRAIEMLESLREMGIALAVDDFGTGYSSLSYLKRLPIQKLKIDRSFVRDIPDDPNDEAISRAIIALGHSMQLEVLAEGVETEAQQAFLVREQCDCVQGYLYSKPVPAADLVRLLKVVFSVFSQARQPPIYYPVPISAVTNFSMPCEVSQF
ncbi:EAL domain-containing protein [Candidatus Reidiella endopervernicosa]|uniref:EAL domain-containing protein n=1 Tax=Candidatus Reidiella endopervernicosa TaxID=2738883 RepID=A0A6N0I1A2_9GAMM|nr:EAL domain-containing protein [Candidatus Reidiella endopervernicosa]